MSMEPLPEDLHEVDLNQMWKRLCMVKKRFLS